MDQIPEMRERLTKVPGRSMVDICAGFRAGSSVLASDGSIVHRQNTARPGPLGDPIDPVGWHALDDPAPPAMRRARRIDVWGDGGVLEIDAMFRDSSWDPDGGEIVVHEYQILGQADRASGVLRSVTAVPRVPPLCRVPGSGAQRIVVGGHRAAGLRTDVLERLRATDCCTHLNDGLRSLAEVPVLAESLPD